MTEMALERGERGVFTREQAGLWAGSRGPRLDALLKRAVASRELYRVRRGLFCLSERYGLAKTNPLELAQRLHGPSYISMESALSHHGWIPEGVQAITSATGGRSRTFETPVGLFTFTRAPQRNLLAGVRRVSEGGGPAYFLATPLKALVDLVYAQRHRWCSAAPVIESLRIEEESLAMLTGELFEEVADAYGPGRMERFLAGLRKDLKL